MFKISFGAVICGGVAANAAEPELDWEPVRRPPLQKTDGVHLTVRTQYARRCLHLLPVRCWDTPGDGGTCKTTASASCPSTPSNQLPNYVDASSGFWTFHMVWFRLCAMNVTRGLLAVLSLVYHTESRCSPTSYYKNCWIRRFPGIFIDIEESQRRGAQLLRLYQEESALKCSRTCCLSRNSELFLDHLLFYSLEINVAYAWSSSHTLCSWLIIFLFLTVSCNLAVFHYDAIQENVNCFHLNCPTLESCILGHKGNVVLYNITKGKSFKFPKGIYHRLFLTWVF